MASLALSFLATPDAYAGTFSAPVYSGGSTGGGDNGPNSSVSPAPFTSNSYYVGNAGYAGYSSGGCNADAQSHAIGITMTASGPLTATFTWQPASPGEPPPASVIICQDCRAALTNYRYGICGASSVCTDGLGGSATLPFSGMQAATESHKYSLKMVAPDGTVSVSCSPNAVYNMSCYPTSGSYAAGAASVSYTASIVNGNWVGPYYFHYGNYYGGGNEGPWAGNTASPTPSITDIPDTTNLFSSSVTTDNNCDVQGSITPVWYWNGPDLGQPPPGFWANVTTTAFARDYYEVSDEELDALDGQENTQQSAPPNSMWTSDTGEKPVRVQSDEYAPGEGNGYWALGPTITMDAHAGDPSEQAPFNLYSSVTMTAEIEGPGNF